MTLGTSGIRWQFETTVVVPTVADCSKLEWQCHAKAKLITLP